MTFDEAYRNGFMSKCAELGMEISDDSAMEKAALVSTYLRNYVPPALIGAGIGAGIGALSDRKKRWRGAMYGALGGAGVGGLARYLASGRLINASAGLDTAMDRLGRKERAARIPLSLTDSSDAGRRAYNRVSKLVDRANTYLEQDRRVNLPELESF